MIEFINNCIRWVADNYKGILTVLTSAQFISLITACGLLIKSLRSGKDNTTATKALNNTMTKTNESATTVTNIAEKVNKLETANANIIETMANNKAEEMEYLDALTTKLNAILEVQSVVYSTIKTEEIRNTVNALLTNAKYVETANRAKLYKEIEDLRTKVASQVTEVQATVDKAADVVKSVVNPEVKSIDNPVRY